METKIVAVVACTEGGGIGLRGKLPWSIKGDLKRFKNLTTGHTIVMGSKTYRSIGKPLPNRRNIVITRSSEPIEGVEIANSIDEILSMVSEEKKVFIIGGAEIYKLFLNIIDEINMLEITGDYETDTAFPEYGDAFFVEKEEPVVYTNDKGESVKCTIKTLIRRTKNKICNFLYLP